MYKIIQNNWTVFPKWLKTLLYKLAYFYDEYICWDIQWIYDVINEIYWQTEYESDWFKEEIIESLEDFKQGKYTAMTLGEFKESLDNDIHWPQPMNFSLSDSEDDVE